MRGLLGAIGATLVAVLVSSCVLLNRFYVPPAFELAEIRVLPGSNQPLAENRIRLASWNIGYAGMGANSDFIMDKGTQRRPLSQQTVIDNLDGIAARLALLDMDVLMLQEVARPSWNTYGVDVLEQVVQNLPEYAHTFGPDIDTRYVPPGLKIEIGNANFSRLTITSAERRALPLEPNFELGMFRKGYRMHILRLAGNERWVLINIHLSAFDSVEHNVRERQLQTVLDFAESEYRQGNRVVIGGDWNMRLAETSFPHTTDDAYLFWIRDIPEHLIPQGWRWAIDKSTPTVRTANQPYVKGENYLLIIDGFLVSPNVGIRSVETLDLDFEFSDHNPVLVELDAR